MCNQQTSKREEVLQQIASMDFFFLFRVLRCFIYIYICSAARLTKTASLFFFITKKASLKAGLYLPPFPRVIRFGGLCAKCC